MLFAKIVVGLPVSGPFDYIVPDKLKDTIKVGSRVVVSFGIRRIVGYVVDLVKSSKISKLKPILELLDNSPLLNKELLLLTNEFAQYYCCSWGEAIEAALPQSLRKGKRVVIPGDTLAKDMAMYAGVAPVATDRENSLILIHDLDGRGRLSVYISEAKKAIKNKKSVIILFPDVPDLLKVSKEIDSQLGIKTQLLYRKQPDELEAWVRVKKGASEVVVGTRSAIFAPVDNLGLIIIEDEGNSVYKQDQVPHYHAREVGIMRSRITGSKLLLGSRAPSLESYYLSKKKEAQYNIIPRSHQFPDIKLIDIRHLPFADWKKGQIVSRILEDAVYSVLNTKDNISGKAGKVLLFLNRKGFATSAMCQSCKKILKCPRCNVNLVYHFKENLLRCHYCNYKIETPKICPECDAGYIKFSGTGTEKMESELSRVFPAARIKILDENVLNTDDADIFISTSSVIRRTDLRFDLIGVLGIDNTLNRVDFRATEKVFSILAGLVVLTDKNMLIQTSSPTHHCFQALLRKDERYFYDEELKQRKQLDFPPFKHIILIKLRGKAEERVGELCGALFSKLKKEIKGKEAQVLSFNPANPPKLRGNYYWQVLTRTSMVVKTGVFLRKCLKDFRHSGIIVTIDVDPV